MVSRPSVPEPAAGRVRGRPSKVRGFSRVIREQLERDPARPSAGLLAQARTAGYTGRKTAFYDLAARLRAGVDAAGPDAPAGRTSLHALGTTTLDYEDGTWSRVTFIGTYLAHSRWLAVTLVDVPTIEVQIRTLLRHLRCVGGFPLVVALERPFGEAPGARFGAGAHRCDPAVALVLARLGTVLEVLPSRKNPLLPGGLGSFIRRTFLKARGFHSACTRHEDLAQQVTLWNRSGLARSGRSPEDVLKRERRALRPAPARIEHLAIPVSRRTDDRGRIVEGDLELSLPVEYANRMVDLELRPNVVVARVGDQVLHFRRGPAEDPAIDPDAA